MAKNSLLALTRRIEVRFMLGCLAIAAALTAFAMMAGEAREGDAGSIDRYLLLAFRNPADPALPIGPRWVQESARDITALGGFTVLTLITVFAVIMLLMLKRQRQALAIAVAVGGAQLASAVLKDLIGRPRPVIVSAHDLVYSSSFPSGHAMMTPVVYLTLAVVLALGFEGRAVRILLLGSAAVLVVAVGVSRVYLGVHWPTDVLAGWALGSAIALAASWFVVRFRPVSARSLPGDKASPPQG